MVCNPGQKFTDLNKNNVNDLCDNSIPSAGEATEICAKRIAVKTSENSSHDES